MTEEMVLKKLEKQFAVKQKQSLCVRNLGMWFDSHLSMSTHVTKLCNSAFIIYIHVILGAFY